MQRYSFTIDGDQEDLVTEHEFEDLAHAKCEAVRFAAQVICDNASAFWDTGDFNMTVTDETGLTLFTLRFVATEAPAIL